jgi:hypothetical protein
MQQGDLTTKRICVRCNRLDCAVLTPEGDDANLITTKLAPDLGTRRALARLLPAVSGAVMR